MIRVIGLIIHSGTKAMLLMGKKPTLNLQMEGFNLVIEQGYQKDGRSNEKNDFNDWWHFWQTFALDKIIQNTRKYPHSYSHSHPPSRLLKTSFFHEPRYEKFQVGISLKNAVIVPKDVLW